LTNIVVSLDGNKLPIPFIGLTNQYGFCAQVKAPFITTDTLTTNWIKRTNYTLQSVSTMTVSSTGAWQSFVFISSKWHRLNSGGGGHGGLNAQNEEQLFWTVKDNTQQTPACLQGDGGRHGDLKVWTTQSESVVLPYLFA